MSAVLPDTESTAPVVKQMRLGLDPAAAFELFTAGMSRWWPLATHSCARAEARRVEVEPRVGGFVLEHAADGSSAPWGTVLAWEPPHRFAMSWHPGIDAARATRLEVEFRPDGEGCAIRLVHGGWEARGDDGPALRQRYDGGWVTVLDRFAAAAGHRGELS